MLVLQMAAIPPYDPMEMILQALYVAKQYSLKVSVTINGVPMVISRQDDFGDLVNRYESQRDSPAPERS